MHPHAVIAHPCLADRINFVTEAREIGSPDMPQTAATPLADAQNRRRKCAQCGLVNFGSAESCRRCHTDLVEALPDIEKPLSRTRGARRTLLLVAVTIGLSIFIWSRSLLLTSAPIDALYLLQQGPDNRIEPVTRIDAARALMRHILFFAHDREMVARVFDSVLQFVSCVQLARLIFTPDSRAWEPIVSERP